MKNVNVYLVWYKHAEADIIIHDVSTYNDRKKIIESICFQTPLSPGRLRFSSTQRISNRIVDQIKAQLLN